MLFLIIGILEFIGLCFIDRKRIKESLKHKNIIIIYFFIVIIMFVILYNIDYINNILKNNPHPIYDFLVLTLFSMGLALVFHIIFLALLQKKYEKRKIKEYENNFNENEYKYYRDIIKNISPAFLSICYDRKFNVEDVVVSTLLDLELRDIIKIENNEITIVGDISNLMDYEKLILDYSKRRKQKKLNEELEQILMNDIKDYNLICLKDDISITYFMELIIAWMIIFLLETIILFINVSQFGWLLIIIYFMIGFVCIPLYEIIKTKINSLVRTEKGLEIAGKLHGLKRFIGDFSKIENEKVDNIKLYDEYVIYAIIFNKKGTLNDDVKKMYENLTSINIYKNCKLD